MSSQFVPRRREEAFTDCSKAEIRRGVLDLPDPFVLECGAALGSARLAWECIGPAPAPLIVVLGGISAHRRCTTADGTGWWQAQCGPGRALDSDRYRLLGVDWLGGCDESTGPDGAGDFPVVSSADQARAILFLLNRLGVRQVHLLVGASYGGAVAQHLAVLLGHRLRRLVVFSAAHRAAQFALALRGIQRAILDLGNATPAALALARALAVLGYRTPEGVEQRFAGSGEGVIEWLAHHGEKFAARFNASAYRCLSASLDGHRIDPAAIRVPTTFFAVREDLLVPLPLAREFAAACAGGCEFVEVSSAFGHDAFLKEEAAVAAVLRNAIGEAA